MKITNKTLVSWLNSIIAFARAEKEHGAALLSAKGEYAVAYNHKILQSAYEPYAEALAKFQGNNEEIVKLLEEEIEIAELKTVTCDDFKDGITMLQITALDFMTV
jgi:hypothetical protein